MTAVPGRPIGYDAAPDGAARPASRGSDVVIEARSNAYRIALAGALIAALSLSACGRKGTLEAPPHANLTSETDNAATAGAGEEQAKKPERKFFLDPLI